MKKFLWVLGTFSLIIVTTLIVRSKIGSSYQARDINCGGSVCNVVLIVNDTLGAKHLGVYGGADATSPFIDEFFGRQGIVFKDASSNAPWTLASFASFFSSQLPSKIYVETYADKLSDYVKTFPKELQSGGVDVAGVLTGDVGVLSKFSKENRYSVEDPFSFQVAEDWILRHESDSTASKKPFFIMVHNRVVHDPYDTPQAYRGLFGAGTYLGPITDSDITKANVDGVNLVDKVRFLRQYRQEIRYLDDLTKDFINVLPKNVLNKTIFILTADHGESFGEHLSYGHANSLYQELVHIPLMMHGPGLSPNVVTQPVALLDLGPTIMGIFGMPPPPSFTGQNLVPAVRGFQIEQKMIRTELASSVWPSAGLTSLVAKVRTSALKERGVVALRLANWKVIKKSDSQLELYNLAADPTEMINLIDQKQNLVSSDLVVVNTILSEISR